MNKGGKIMKKKKLRSIISLIAVMVIILSGCSNGDKNASGSYDYEQKGENGAVDEAVTEEMEMGSTTADSSVEEDTKMSTTKNIQKANVKNDNQKMIKNFHIDLETQEFDSVLLSVQERVKFFTGYIENAEIGGTSYYSKNLRSAHMVIRVPKEKVDQFVKTVKDSDIANVVRESETAQDVTLAYVDIESHQKALSIEQERLLSLLKKAEKIADIIELENRLSEVRYELESYTSKLRTYDNLVDYSTVTLEISEVERMKAVEEKTVGDKMKNGLSQTGYNIKTGAQNFAIWFVVNLPYIIIWSIVIIVGIIVGRKIYKKTIRKVEKEESQEEEEK
jgi:hypothetical protein